MLAHKSQTPETDRDSWRTPLWLFEALDHEFNFGLDAAASYHNALCPHYFTIEDNALAQNWADVSHRVFCNPPYSRGCKEQFFQKAIEECENDVTTVFVVPALPSEGWFPWKTASEIRFISGRIKFVHPVHDREMDSPPAGTCIIIFRKWGSLRVVHYERDVYRMRRAA